MSDTFFVRLRQVVPFVEVYIVNLFVAKSLLGSEYMGYRNSP